MNRRDIMHRLAGVAVLLGAGASTMLYHTIWLGPASEPVASVEGALSVLTFALASFGLLLVIGGARLRDGWKRDCERAARRRTERAGLSTPPPDDEESRRIMAAAAMDSAAFAGGRGALATFLVMRARQAAAQAKFVSQTTTEKCEPGAHQ